MLSRVTTSLFLRFMQSRACGGAVRAITRLTVQDRLPGRSTVRSPSGVRA